MARVKLQRLSKAYDGTLAVKSLDLEVRDKEFVVLLGPSGCGKTTTLRCVAGLESPDEGEIYIGERLVNDLDPKDRNIAMVFQNYALYPHMTVYKNLAFPLENQRLPKGEIDGRVQKTAKLLQIERLLGRKPAQLSGGQQQRVAVGRAIVREPQAFLMDEPLSNLDAKLRVHMRAELKRLQKDIGVTTIYVTHDQVEAMTMADRVAIMNGGLLQQFGSPTEIFRTPANQFVGGFIGNPPMNFLDGSVGPEGTFDLSIFKFPLPADLAEVAGRASSDELVLGIRPQDVRVSLQSTEEPCICTETFATEPLGDQTILDVKVGDALVRAIVVPDFPADMGTEVWISFPARKLHLFDKRTGKALV